MVDSGNRMTNHGLTNRTTRELVQATDRCGPKPAKDIPLKDGYFELQLPKAFFKDNPKSITVNWIDFYQN